MQAQCSILRRSRRHRRRWPTPSRALNGVAFFSRGIKGLMSGIRLKAGEGLRELEKSLEGPCRLARVRKAAEEVPLPGIRRSSFPNPRNLPNSPPRNPVSSNPPNSLPQASQRQPPGTLSAASLPTALPRADQCLPELHPVPLLTPDFERGRRQTQ